MTKVLQHDERPAFLAGLRFQRFRIRYCNSLVNLCYSIKTPLSIRLSRTHYQAVAECTSFLSSLLYLLKMSSAKSHLLVGKYHEIPWFQRFVDSTQPHCGYSKFQSLVYPTSVFLALTSHLSHLPALRSFRLFPQVFIFNFNSPAPRPRFRKSTIGRKPSKATGAQSRFKDTE